VYISSRSSKDCTATASELNSLGPGTCIPIPADLQNLDEVGRLVRELSGKEKALHVLINNAGAAWAADIEEYPVSCLLVSPGGTSPSAEILTAKGRGIHEVIDAQPPARVHPHAKAASVAARRGVARRKAGRRVQRPGPHYQCSSPPLLGAGSLECDDAQTLDQIRSVLWRGLPSRLMKPMRMQLQKQHYII
jgi:NAD(P)-dependent dehydrogenase (short-subunit alcohol dehydrogenase family)